jgi:putative spermidine/putrescine transport system ATP-binding protein
VSQSASKLVAIEARSIQSTATVTGGVSLSSQQSPIHLSLKQIVKRFGSVTALCGIDLDLRQGEILTILGPSGSGKSTMLKIVAGFEMPDAGTVHLAGRTITYATPASRGIGMVFQNYALFPHLLVAENVAFPLEMRKLGRKEIQQEVSRALNLVGLAGYEDRSPRQLSGGQQQRVALARAIVFNPHLLLLDEPFGALDRKLREQMQLEVKRLQRRLGVTALFVTHDQEEALILSDRIAVMNQGQIEQIGPPPEIYARPVNRFVAAFVGESNVYHGRVASYDRQMLSIVLDNGQTIGVSGVSERPSGSEVGVVMRPEAPRRLTEHEPADNVFTGEVREVVYLGEAGKYALELVGGLQLVVRWPFNATAQYCKLGARVRVSWPSDSLHVVDWN